jgi:Putative beta-barrel porin-2, OmpL-like. bbp2
MSRSWMLPLVVLAVLAGPAAAGEPPPLRVSGFVEGAYAASNHAVDGRIPGNLYLSRHDSFALDGAMLKVERTVPAGSPGSGFVVEAMAGDHAGFVRAAGLDLGEHADIIQAYGSLSFPAAGVVVSAGKMATMLGSEVIETVANPNLSVGWQYVFVENFTDTGVDVAWAGGSGWSARARLTNGWDVVADNNRSKTVFGRLGWTGPAAGVALFGFTGTELPDSIGGQRSGAELLASATIGPAVVTLQLDAGREEALDDDWRAAGLWVRVPLRAGAELALRGDLLDDEGGARTSGALGMPAHDGQQLASLTATLGLRLVPGALVRPELRWDRSDREAFAGHREQWTAALGAAFTF